MSRYEDLQAKLKTLLDRYNDKKNSGFTEEQLQGTPLGRDIASLEQKMDDMNNQYPFEDNRGGKSKRKRSSRRKRKTKRSRKHHKK